jgi:hypothetical protein
MPLKPHKTILQIKFAILSVTTKDWNEAIDEIIEKMLKINFFKSTKKSRKVDISYFEVRQIIRHSIYSLCQFFREYENNYYEPHIHTEANYKDVNMLVNECSNILFNFQPNNVPNELPNPELAAIGSMFGLDAPTNGVLSV